MHSKEGQGKDDNIPTVVRRPQTARTVLLPASISRPSTCKGRESQSRPRTAASASTNRTSVNESSFTPQPIRGVTSCKKGSSPANVYLLKPETYLFQGFSRPQTAPASGRATNRSDSAATRRNGEAVDVVYAKKVRGILEDVVSRRERTEEDSWLERATALDILIKDAQNRDALKRQGSANMPKPVRAKSAGMWAKSLTVAIPPLEDDSADVEIPPTARPVTARITPKPPKLAPTARCQSAFVRRTCEQSDPSIDHRYHNLDDRLLGNFAETKKVTELMRVNVEKLYTLTRRFLKKYEIEDETYKLLNAKHDVRMSTAVQDTQNKAENDGGGKKARFEKQSEYLHEIFMWMIRGCIDLDKPHDVARFNQMTHSRSQSQTRSRTSSRLPMVTDTFDRLIWNPGDMGNEEQDIPDDWNYLPASDEKSSGRATVGVYFAHRLPALDDVRGRGGELRRIMSALRRKKRVGPPLDSYYQPSGLTHEELARVREYVGKVAHQRRILNEDEQGFGTLTTLSLRDWERTNEGRDPIWNPRTFSVSRFITDYVSMYWKMYGYDSMEDTIDAFEIVQRQQLTEMTEKLEQEKAAAKEAKHVNLEFDGEDKDGKQTDSSKLPRSRAASVIKPKRQASTFRGSRFNLSSSRKASTSSLYQLNKKKSYDVTRRSAILTGDDNVLHRASEIQAAPLTDPWRYHHSDCVNILKKPGWQRTSEEIRVVAKIMRNLSAFRGYSDFIIGQVSGSLRYQYVDANRVIIKQGDVASAWYIILSGSVNVQVSSTGRIEDSINVKTLYTGESFGDIALVNNETRAATVVTVDPCELVKIEKSEYDRVLKFIHEKEKTAMVNFLRFLDMFEDWKYSQLRTIAQTMNFRRILPGALIIEEGKHCSEFMLIREGVVAVFKNIGTSGRRREIKVAVYGPGDYVCEEGVLFDSSSDQRSRFTLRAGERRDEIAFEKSHGAGMLYDQIEGKKTVKLPTHRSRNPGVTLAVIDAFDAKNKFGHIVSAHPNLEINEKGIKNMQKNEALMTRWRKYRKTHVSKILRERRGNMDVSLEKEVITWYERTLAKPA